MLTSRSLLLFLLLLLPSLIRAQDNPYIVAYDHYLEDPGTLEVEYFSNFGSQRLGNIYHAFWLETEYGAASWWTTGFYLDGQNTFGESAVFTGFRLENRFRPFKREHFINPVLYLQYANKNGADKILKEVEGHDVESNFLTPNSAARKEHIHELEVKLILSRTFRGWNFTQNTLAAKNLSGGPWEFGYALAAGHSLSVDASGKPCTFCRKNFTDGVEMYGGLGDRHSFGLRQTSHYLAPVIAFNLPSNWTVRVSTAFGLNDNSHRLLFRCGVAREFHGFGSMLGRFFGGLR